MPKVSSVFPGTCWFKISDCIIIFINILKDYICAIVLPFLIFFNKTFFFFFLIELYVATRTKKEAYAVGIHGWILRVSSCMETIIFFLFKFCTWGIGNCLSINSSTLPIIWEVWDTWLEDFKNVIKLICCC